MNDNSSSLPHGFFDYVGENAELRREIYNEFIKIGKSFGMDDVHLCPIGYESTFTKMGTINEETVYPFKDNGGRDLMLSADSLSSMTRMFRNLMNSARTLKGRYVGKSEIFRNRRKKYRNWSHLIGTYFNESNELAGDISIILFAKTFLEKYYKSIKFNINDYGILNEVFKESNITPEQGYEMLYRMYTKKEESDFAEYGEASQIIRDIDEIAIANPDYKEKLDAIAKKYEFLQPRVNILKRYCNVIEKNGVNFDFVFGNYRAIEYHSGLYFYVRDDVRNCNIADGGGYHRSVNKVDNRIKLCHSFACSLEDIVTHVLREKESNTKKNNSVYALKLDASDEFFYRVCEYLRKLGYNVNDIWAEENVKKVLSKLPRDYKKVFIGSQEEESQRISIKGENQYTEINLNDNNEFKREIAYSYKKDGKIYKIIPITYKYDSENKEIKHCTKVILPTGEAKLYKAMSNPYRSYNYAHAGEQNENFIPIMHPKFDTIDYLRTFIESTNLKSFRIFPYESGVVPQQFSDELIEFLRQENIFIVIDVEDYTKGREFIKSDEWENFLHNNKVSGTVYISLLERNDVERR